MLEVLAMLSGKKTYIVAAIMALGAFARALGWMDQNQFELLLSLGGSLGLAALRAGVSKLDQ